MIEFKLPKLKSSPSLFNTAFSLWLYIGYEMILSIYTFKNLLKLQYSPISLIPFD